MKFRLADAGTDGGSSNASCSHESSHRKKVFLALPEEGAGARVPSDSDATNHLANALIRTRINLALTIVPFAALFIGPSIMPHRRTSVAVSIP